MPLTQKEIQERTLHELLYNEVDGERKPQCTDVVQHRLSMNCYLLGNLIELAKDDPGFIMKNLIETPS